MDLLRKQFLFTHLVADFILSLEEMGYHITLGQAERPPEIAKLYAEQGKGISTSLHLSRLAIDLNLFKNGKYLTLTEDYREAGELWESMSTSGVTCAWGGRFKRPDGNHFSLEHDGVR